MGIPFNPHFQRPSTETEVLVVGGVAGVVLSILIFRGLLLKQVLASREPLLSHSFNPHFQRPSTETHIADKHIFGPRRLSILIFRGLLLKRDVVPLVLLHADDFQSSFSEAFY